MNDPIPKRRTNEDGFSLVELAIVLVIFGLLTAGVLAAKAMIASAEVRVLVAEVQDFKLQTDNFFSRYDAMPGDIKNANSFWPNADNGNEDGRIDEEESFQFWKHLQLAGLIAGSYAGTGPDAAIGTNVPQSRRNFAGYDVLWHDAPGGWQDQLGRYLKGNYIRIGKEPSSTGDADFLTASALDGATAAAVDEKMDNGVPKFGSVLGLNGEGAASCYQDAGASYDYSVKLPQCVLLFSLGYGK